MPSEGAATSGFGAGPPQLIFDNKLYESDVLRLPEDSTEQDLDEKTALKAQALGLQGYDVGAPTDATSEWNSAGETRHLHSVDLENSRHIKSDAATKETALDVPLPRSHKSSIENQRNSTENVRPKLKHTATTTSTSSSAVGSTSSEKDVSRKRGSGLLSFFRKDRNHRRQNSQSRGFKSNPYTQTLQCGHTMTRGEIRALLEQAYRNEKFRAPSCCGMPITGSVLEVVLSPEELETFKRVLLASHKTRTGAEEDKKGKRKLQPQACVRSKADAVSSIEGPNTEDLKKAMKVPSFTTMRDDQESVFRRLMTFELKQMQALSRYHSHGRSKLTSRQSKERSELVGQLKISLKTLEELQLQKELDLEARQKEETKSLATQIKYMEAYCANGSTRPPSPTSDSSTRSPSPSMGSVGSSGPTTGYHLHVNRHIDHPVTPGDLDNLSRHRMLQHELPGKHQSAINVLRARQNKTLETRESKSAAALEDLTREQDEERNKQLIRFREERRALRQLNEERRQRLAWRWRVDLEAWIKDEGWEGDVSNLELLMKTGVTINDGETESVGDRSEEIGLKEEEVVPVVVDSVQSRREERITSIHH